MIWREAHVWSALRTLIVVVKLWCYLITLGWFAQLAWSRNAKKAANAQATPPQRSHYHFRAGCKLSLCCQRVLLIDAVGSPDDLNRGIKEMAAANRRWDVEHIRGELFKHDIRVATTTVQRRMRRARPPPAGARPGPPRGADEAMRPLDSRSCLCHTIAHQVGA